MNEKRKFRIVPPSERGYEIVELIKEKGEEFVLIKVRLADVGRLALLKTDEKRREYQKEAQRRYRKKLASKQNKD
jgi:radical SAM superfamily enzyme YgiQ (UPF0313 family)